MVPLINFNGELVSKSSSVFSFEHLAIFNGEIIQENLRLKDGEILYAEKHYFHLMAMMRMARMEIPMHLTPDFFYQEINKLIDNQRLENAKISFNVSTTATGIDFWVSAKMQISDLIHQLPYEIDQYRDTHFSTSAHDKIQFLNPKNRILDTYAFENNFQDLVLINQEKAIARAIHGNLFLIKDGVLYTPNVEDGAIDSVYREMTIEAAKRVPDLLTVKVENVFPFALMKADEVFVVKDGEGFFPVTQFRKKEYNSLILPSIVEYFEELG